MTPPPHQANLNDSYSAADVRSGVGVDGLDERGFREACRHNQPAARVSVPLIDLLLHERAEGERVLADRASRVAADVEALQGSAGCR
jgi:hypothetical protein